MKIYNGFSDKRLKLKPRAVAIGVFDGVHRGHQKILRMMLADAKKMRISPCVVTFDPHPERVLKGAQSDTDVLLSLAHRLSLLAEHGVRECVIVRFNRAFSRVGSERFLNDFLLSRLGMRSLSVGAGFRFGHRAQGNEKMLRGLTQKEKFRFHAIAPLKISGAVVSSTRIRRLILKGRLHKASALLGRPYAVVGTVIKGNGRGRKLGFPTANLDPHHEILPPPAVYAAEGRVGRRRLPAVVHLGERPTFLDRQKTLEVHFPDLHRNLYDKDIELRFIKRLRSIRRFTDPNHLIRAIRLDIQELKKLTFYSRRIKHHNSRALKAL